MALPTAYNALPYYHLLPDNQGDNFLAVAFVYSGVLNNLLN
jgi:hypothetical protein